MKYSLCDARLKIQKIKISPFTNFYKVFTWNCLDSTGISHVAFSTQINVLMAKCKQWHQQRSNCYVCIFAGDQLNCYKPPIFFLAVKISRQCQTFLPYRIPTFFPERVIWQWFPRTSNGYFHQQMSAAQVASPTAASIKNEFIF